MRALFFGDSLTDDHYVTTQTWRSGFYADLVCPVMGWTRIGQTPNDPNRAAISATLLESSTLVPPAYNTNAGIASFDRRVQAYNPEVVVINYGTNDFYWMSQGLSLDSWEATWETFWGAIQTLTALQRPVIALGLMESVGRGIPLPTWAYNAEWLRARMNMVTREAALRRNCVFVPLDGVNESHVRADGHPNARGHAYIAGEILAYLGVQ